MITKSSIVSHDDGNVAVHASNLSNSKYPSLCSLIKGLVYAEKKLDERFFQRARSIQELPFYGESVKIV